jgi:cell division protein FtsI (penicillin-binding protein 3)
MMPTAREPMNRRDQTAEHTRPARLAAMVQLEGAAKQALETGRTRLLVASLLFAAAFLVIGLRLLSLGLLAPGQEPSLAETPRASQHAAVRADIIDRNRTVLATTLPTASLYANPRQIRDPALVADRLAAILPELSPSATAVKLASERSFVWLKRKLTPREQYRVNRLGIPGLYFQREQERVYPHGALTAHVVGFANVDNQGLAGIEQAFEETLRGSPDPVQLSLDLRVQHIMAEELAAAMAEFKAIGASTKWARSSRSSPRPWRSTRARSASTTAST